MGPKHGTNPFPLVDLPGLSIVAVINPNQSPSWQHDPLAINVSLAIGIGPSIAKFHLSNPPTQRLRLTFGYD